MGMNMKIKNHYSLSFPLFIAFLLISPLLSNAHNTHFIFKDCGEKLQDPSGTYTKNLKSLMVSLVAQSGQKHFYRTTSGEGKNMIMGLYQCREDITNSSCYNCVSKATEVLDKLCGKRVVQAARVHFSGCYIRYEVVGYKQVVPPPTQLLNKVCGAKKEIGDDGFMEKREKVFDMVVNGMKNGGKLFSTESYECFNVLGQCVGDMVDVDCAMCIKNAHAKSECGDSVNG